jgi:hypothetical protein
MSDKSPVHTSKPHGINWDDDDVATKEQTIYNLLNCFMWWQGKYDVGRI